MPYPLLTPRLSIEPLSLKDIEAFVGYRQDPAIARYQGWETSYSKDQAVELIQSQVDVVMPTSGNWLQLAIHDRETDELLGDLALHALKEAEHSHEIGFTLASKNHGEGIAREAVSRLLDYLFDEIGTESVCASCDTRNTSSIKLLTAMGFENRPTKSWVEEFKEESIVMNYFEMTKHSFDDNQR